MTKVCCTCKQEKTLDNFYASRKAKDKDGRQPGCKECLREYKRTPEFKAKDKAYRQRPERKQAETDRRKNPVRVLYMENYLAEYEQRDSRKQSRKERSTSEATHVSRRKHYTESPEIFLVQAAKARSRQFGVPFDLTPLDIPVPPVCPILGVELKVGQTNRSDASPSLDRIIPELGYVLGNIAVISWRANRIKNNGTAEDHRAIARWMSAAQDGLLPGNIPLIHNNSAHVRTLLYSAQKRAKTKGVECSIQTKNIVIPMTCPILGIPLEHGKGKLHNNSPTLDRINANLGYVLGNVAVVSYHANRMKNDGTAEEHLKIADWMDKMCGTITSIPLTHHEEPPE